MEKEIKKRFCLVYDTFKEMITDPDIISDMVVMTLGHDTVDDGLGAIYRVSTKDSNKTKHGESFGLKSPFYAESIVEFSHEDMKSLILENHQLIKGLGHSFNNFNKMINDNISLSNQVFQEIMLNDEGTVRVIQTFNGMRYIVDERENNTKIEKSITITNENTWLLPTEFVINNICTFKSIGTNMGISYNDGTLTFTLELTNDTPKVIPY